jgi:hypothetical protein
MNLMRRSLILLLCGFLIGLAGCGTEAPTPHASPIQSPLIASPISSPINTPDKSASSSIVKFEIDRPMKAGATVVTGRGPAGVPITIVGVTTMGNDLGSGVIGADNHFAIQVAPLTPNVRIGIAIGDLTGTNFRADEFDANAYKGAEALMVPLVGYFLDTTMVLP